MSTLVIDATGFVYRKSFSYNSYLMDLLNYFSRNRNNIKYDRVVVACDNSQKMYFKQFNNMEICGLNCLGYLRRFKIQNRFHEIFKLCEADTILFTGPHVSLTKKCHQILVIFDLIYLHKEFVKKLSFIWKMQRLFFVPLNIKMADKIITISEWVKSDVENNYPSAKGKTEAIYIYINFGKYSKIEPTVEITKIIKNDYFLMVSTDSPYKNISTVVKAFANCAIIKPGVEMVIVGKMTEERKNQIANLPSEVNSRIIILSGLSDSDLGFLYSNAKAFVTATLHEGFGLPLVEALYCGTKVIGSNIDVVKEATDSKAIYFNPTDDKELTFILQNIDNYPESSLTKEEIARKYSEENTSGQYIELLNSVKDLKILDSVR